MSSWTNPIPVSISGATWDGGPSSQGSLLSFTQSGPELHSSQGSELGSRFAPIPRLEFSDEGALAISQDNHRVISSRVRGVANCWNTYGPITNSSRLMRFTTRYREWYASIVGWPKTSWAAQAVTVRPSTSVCVLSQPHD